MEQDTVTSLERRTAEALTDQAGLKTAMKVGPSRPGRHGTAFYCLEAVRAYARETPPGLGRVWTYEISTGRRLAVPIEVYNGQGVAGLCLTLGWNSGTDLGLVPTTYVGTSSGWDYVTLETGCEGEGEGR